MLSFAKVFICCCLLSLCIAGNCWAQDSTATADSLITGAPKVYIDCHTWHCDMDYFRTEITFVNQVRDRKQADIHILISTQETGAGGEKFTIEFIGQRDYAGMADTLKFTSMEADSDDDIRSGLARILKLGLVRYVVKTPLAEHMSVDCTLPAETSEVVDKWNYWVFSISGNCWFDGEEGYRNISSWGEIDARRVTENLRIELELYGNYNESKFDYEDYKALSLSRSKGFHGEIYFSLGDHWSAGATGRISSSTYGNTKLYTRAGPTVEYNLYHYSESNRRQLRFIYSAYPRYSDYEEVTIYDETAELLFAQSISVTLELVQPWGSVYSSLSGSHYFDDFKKNYLQLYSSLSLRLFQGFSLNLNGNISRVRDQLALRKGEATQEEVLLRRQELETSYNYWGSIGISYSFGSIYNNIVNPRFGN